MRWALFAVVLSAGCGGVPKPVVQTATTSIDTQAQTAKAAVATCGAEGDMREAACDRVIKSLDEIVETNAALKAQAQ